MTYEEVHNRYGTHVAQRIRRELTPSEFSQVELEKLPKWLEQRAEAAHDHYKNLLSNPLTAAHTDVSGTGEACRRWREAEDLAYLVTIAEDVGATVRAG